MLSRIRATLFCATLAALTALSSLSPTSAAAQASRPTPRAVVAPKTTEQIAALGRRATVTILALDAAGDTISQGSGVLIREDGVVVTNWHVMAGASRAKVRLSNGEVVDRVLFLEGDSTADLAILRLATLGVPTAPTTTTVPDPGARVTVIGAPQGLSLSVSDGVVSATRLVNGKTLVQLTAAISPGSSGGPVFDSQGRVFAIATSSLESGQALNFAMPIRYALALLPLATTPRSLESVFAASAAAPTTPASAPTRSQAASKPLPGGFQWPTPTERPARTLTGSYGLTVRYASAPGRDPNTGGVMVIDGDNNGLLLVDRASGSAVNMFDVLTTQTGRVSFKVFGDEIATGYQTEAGFFALLPYRTDTVFFEAALRDLSLNRPDGLYDVSSRTEYRFDNGRLGSELTDWRGTAIVVASQDSIWTTLSLTNTMGGTSGSWARARLEAGNRFRWQDRDGDRLSGTISGGALNLEWVDKRDGGAFAGWLRGQRR